MGGFTNLGLPGRRFGQRWEVPLSGSVILAKTSKGAVFNGNIKYSNMTHPEDGVMTSGDVKVVASGLRNAFFLSLHSSGRLYAMDNGPNNGYGNIAANCAEKDIDIIYPKDPPGNWPGTVKVDGPPWARFSTKRPDKLVHIKLDKIARYYGHPNFNRGECAWIDPFTGRDALDRAPPENYEAPLGMFESSVNAVIEYHAGNIFDGALKGQLILSTFKNRKTYAIRAISSGSEAKADVIAIHGGLSMAMNARGDLIVPRIKANNILVLRPKVPRLEGRETMSITAVTPFRHGRGGRTMATIGGYNFGGETVVVKIGGRRCRVRMQSDRVIRCRVPAAVMGGSVVDVTVRKRGGEIARLERGVWYMQV